MCGRFTLRATLRQLAEFFALTREPQLESRTTIVPTQMVFGVVCDPDTGQRQLASFRWGLIPSWAKDPLIGPTLINAHSETAATKPAFRSAFRRRRCLIPADGFYEWRKIPGQKKKQPCHLSVRGRPVIAFAGLWDRRQGENSAEIRSCTILTTLANAAMASPHDRMPVILSPDGFEDWLALDQDPAQLEALLRPYPAVEMVLSEELADELLAVDDAASVVKPGNGRQS